MMLDVGFPMSLIAGLVLLTLLMSQMSTFLTELFMMGLQFMQELLESLSGA